MSRSSIFETVIADMMTGLYHNAVRVAFDLAERCVEDASEDMGSNVRSGSFATGSSQQQVGP